MDKIIELIGVEKRYDGIHAVRGGSLEVAHGETLVLLGSSMTGPCSSLTTRPTRKSERSPTC